MGVEVMNVTNHLDIHD